MATAIEFENVGNILEGFRSALGSEEPRGPHSALSRVATMMLAHECEVLPSYGKRWSAFLAQMERYALEKHLPIIEFPTGNDSADLAGSTVGVVEDAIIRQASIPANVAIGLKYIVDECVDKGVTVLGSYKANSDPDINTDLEALQAANRGISTKNRPDAENRGYGLMTSQKMVVSGLGGAFSMISGGAVYVNDRNGRRFLDSANSLNVPGTIVALRFPYYNNGFNYIDYIE